MQNDQHWYPHGRGATEGQDETHSAPDAEADEDEGDEDQLLVSHRGGAALQLVCVAEDGPVLRERFPLHRGQEQT